MMVGRNEDGLARSQALGMLSELRTMFERLPGDDPAYQDLLERRLAAGAEALNAGLDEHTVQAVGNFSHAAMREAIAIAEEFATDDQELDLEVRGE